MALAMTMQVERPKSLTDIALAAIREAIITGKLDMGSQISEAVLATSLGLSKTPVREALLRLQGEGLVTVIPQKGTFVFSLQAGEVTALCELRLALESAALALAAERGRAALIAGWGEIIEAMREAIAAEDADAYLMQDTAFHECLIAAAANPYFTDAYALISAKVTTLRLKLGRDPFHTEKSFAEHGALLDCARNGDIAKAQDILRRHIARKEGSYWEHLNPQPPRFLTR